MTGMWGRARWRVDINKTRAVPWGRVVGGCVRGVRTRRGWLEDMDDDIVGRVCGAVVEYTIYSVLKSINVLYV